MKNDQIITEEAVNSVLPYGFCPYSHMMEAIRDGHCSLCGCAHERVW